MRLNTRYLLVLLFLFGFNPPSWCTETAVDSLLQYTGRIIYSNPKEAARISKQLIAQDEPALSCENSARAYFVHGRAASFLGDFDLAIESLYQALALCSQIDDLLLAEINLEISDLYCRLKDYRKSFQYNDIALALFKVHQDSMGIAACHNNRGIVHANLYEYQTAEQCFQSALAINKKLGNIKGIAANLNNLCLYEGDSDKKLALIEEAIIINKNLNADWAVCENYNNKGKQLFYAQRYEEALAVLLAVRQDIAQVGSKELECDNYEYLSWVYAAMGNYKQAHAALTHLFLMTQELQNDEKLRTVERNLSEKRMLEQERERDLKEQHLKIRLLQRNILILTICLIGFAVAAVFIPRWYKRRKDLELAQTNLSLERSQREIYELKVQQQKEHLKEVEQHLKEVNREATTFAMFIKNRNDLLCSIRQKLKAGQKFSGDRLKQHLKELNLFVRQAQLDNTTDSLLLASIEAKNRDYLERLLSKHPDLTAGEKNLALLLRIDLSSKDIALLIGSNPKTVNMNRYRLRKTLNLESGANLTSYLQSI